MTKSEFRLVAFVVALQALDAAIDAIISASEGRWGWAVLMTVTCPCFALMARDLWKEPS